MPRTRQSVPSRARITGVRTVTIAVQFQSSSQKNVDEFFASLSQSLVKVSKNRARQTEHDTKVEVAKVGRITWDD